MLKRTRSILKAALLASAAALALPAAADTVRVEARLVADGEPTAALAGLPVRIAVGNGAELRKADAGATYVTDAEGRIAFETQAPVTKRRITLDSIFFRHDAWFVEVGVELDLVGRTALYIVRLDLVRDGTVGVMTASLRGKGGDFDAPLLFHDDTHSWTFPDEPDGWRLGDIGARLSAHEMEGSPGLGWLVRLEIAKQEFTVR